MSATSQNLLFDGVLNFDVLLVKRIDSIHIEFVRHLFCETIDQSRAPGRQTVIDVCL